MTLEEASYIFGIVGSIAAVGGLYFAWKSHRAKKVAAAALPEKKKEELIRALPHTDQEDALRVGFESTKKMFRHSERDAALVSLVRKAVASGDWRLALEVADAMFYHEGKDTVLSQVVDAAIAKREWRTAALASDLMFYRSVQDAAKKRLAEVVER